MGQHYDNWTFEEEALFKKGNGFSSRRARSICKVIARAEKRAEKNKFTSGAKGIDIYPARDDETPTSTKV